MITLNDLLVMVPELYLTAAACFVLLFDVFINDDQRDATHWVAIIVMLVGIFLVVHGQPDTTATAFGGMFVRDRMAEILKVTVLIATILMYVMARPWLRDRQLFMGEFYSLSMFSVLGVMLLVSAGNLITVYLGLELFALPAYALVALNRESKLSSEAAIKFFVLGSLASGLILFGMSLIYGATGTLDLHGIFAAAGTTTHPHLLQFGLVFLVVGIGFEFGAVPFHMWLPDVYEGAPTPIAMYISAVPKLAAVGLAYRLLEVGMGPFADDWRIMLAIMAALSLVVGNVVAIAQKNLKRMLAYSTISHMGFVFLGLANPTPEGYSAALFYAVCFALMETVAFGVILALARKGFECEMIDDLKGLNRRSPWFAGMMAIAMFSLAGIPPLWGFIAKVLVLKAAIDGGMLWLAIVAIICSIIGLFYYLRVIWVMYFEQPAEGVEPLQAKPDLALRGLLSINALGLVAMIFFSGPLLAWCRAAFGG
ncbi:MAG: NADH-quinone oxidoreductase subunit NuoN [Xanthomonadales bacterium]|nr:NADH-quinone oxidoreductase subunit NuoN [Xanthomonadales bacterium]ODU93792.1 MAG: NADH-quinone oxidoreductase subunit N [Rhodanobacter sp. SCN 66-43]OJY83245.1 MAG: NADH-quinone oxidoreductase subunit N [Xanthomonadales bacterium 66-474]